MYCIFISSVCDSFRLLANIPKVKKILKLYFEVQIFRNGSSKVCGRQPLKNLRGIVPLKMSRCLKTSIFLKAVLHKFVLANKYFVSFEAHILPGNLRSRSSLGKMNPSTILFNNFIQIYF